MIEKMMVLLNDVRLLEPKIMWTSLVQGGADSTATAQTTGTTETTRDPDQTGFSPFSQMHANCSFKQMHCAKSLFNVKKC